MALISGMLADVTLANVADRSPELVWTPSSATTGPGGRLLTGVPIVTIPAANGAWSVYLEASELTSPPITYSLKIRLLDPDAGYVWLDFLDWDISVPSEGGDFADFADRPTAGGMVWEVAGDTIPASARPGDLMLNTLTSDLYRIG